MAVTSCTATYERFTASADERRRASFTVRYHVVCNRGANPVGPQDLVAAARASSPHALPNHWASYVHPVLRNNADTAQDAYPYSYAMEFDVIPWPDSRWDYYIDVHYRPLQPATPANRFVNNLNIGGGDGGGGWDDQTNPELRPTVFWFDREVYTRSVEEDRNGAPILNYALKPYDVPVEQEETRAVLVAEFNVLTLQEVIDLAANYENHVNWTEDWIIGTVATGQTTVPKGQALCREVISGPPVIENALSYFHVTMRFPLKSPGETWAEPRIERGFSWFTLDEFAAGEYLLDEDGVRKYFSDGFGDPQLLNSDGTKKPPSTLTLPDVTFWETRPDANFTNIQFPGYS